MARACPALAAIEIALGALGGGSNLGVTLSGRRWGTPLKARPPPEIELLLA
jgi:hypothetical protein